VLRPALGGFFEKIGVSMTSLTRGEHADFLLSSEPLSDGARRRLRDMVEDTYELFIGRVAEGRGIDAERVDVLGRGRVYTGAQALELGLIDELGGLQVAVAAGRSALGLDEDTDVALLTYPPPMSLAEEISDALQSRIATQVSLSVPLPPAVWRFGVWLASLPSEGLLLVPPVLIDIR
jgi:protease-4